MEEKSHQRQIPPQIPHRDPRIGQAPRTLTIASAQIGLRACSTCLLHHFAMKTSRHLHWGPVKERFLNDDQANCMLSRLQRVPYLLNP